MYICVFCLHSRMCGSGKLLFYKVRIRLEAQVSRSILIIGTPSRRTPPLTPEPGRWIRKKLTWEGLDWGTKVLAGEGRKEQKGRAKTGKDRILKIIQLPPKWTYNVFCVLFGRGAGLSSIQWKLVDWHWAGHKFSVSVPSAIYLIFTNCILSSKTV